MKWKAIFNLIILLIVISQLFGCVEEPGKDNDNSVVHIEDNIGKIEDISGFTYERETNITFIDINYFNITKVNFTLKWIDDSIDFRTRLGIPINELDIFDLEFIPPGNLTANFVKHSILDEENETGFVFINVYINNCNINESGEEYYFHQVPLNPINESGYGKWQLNITCVDAPGYRTECLRPYKTEDEGNSWTLLTNVRYFYSYVK